MVRVHAEDTSAPLVEVAHDVAGELVADLDFQVDDRLKKDRAGLHEAVLEGKVGRGLECLLGGVDRMVGTVIQGSLDADDRISSQRALLYALGETLLNRRIVVLRDSAADDFDRELVRLRHVAARLEAHLDVTVLAVSAGLLLVLAFDVGFLADRLAESDLRLGEIDVDFVAFFQLALDDLELLVADTVEQGLTVRGVIFNAEALVFRRQLGEGGSDLVFFTLLDGFVALHRVRCGDPGLCKCNRSRLGRQGIAGGDVTELRESADIAGEELRNFLGLVADHHVELAEALVIFLLHVVERVVGLDDAGADLDEVVFADERVGDGLPDISGLRFLEIIVGLEYLIGLLVDALAGSLSRIREDLNDIVQQVGNTLKVDRSAHANRNDRAVADVGRQRGGDLKIGELFAGEIAVHELLGSLGDGLKERLSVGLKILLKVFRNRALDLLLLVHELASALLDDGDIADELAVLTDRHVDRGDLLAVHFLQLLDDASEADIVIVHLGHEEHARDISLLAELPCLLGADLDAVLAGDDDDRRIRDADSLLDLADEIEVAGRVKDVDLAFIPLYRYDRAADGEFSLLLFRVVVADGIAVGNLSHSGSKACQISHGFREGCFACAPMTKQNDISDFIRSVNVHLIPSKYII